MAVSVSIEGSGSGAQRTAFKGHKPMKFVSGTLTFDSSYPTGGESISDITAHFSSFKGIVFGQLSNRIVVADTTSGAEKALLYTALGTEAANASNQSTISVPFLAWGYGVN